MDRKGSSQQERIRRYADMIQRQTGRAVRPYREDGYVNMLNRYGTSKDVSEHYRYVPEQPVPDEVLTQYYESNGLFAKIIDTPAEEAVKHGFSIDSIKDQDLESFYLDAVDALDWEEAAMTAVKWARLFGGSIIVMLIDDGRGLEEPLDWKNIRSIDDLRVYDRSLIQPDYESMYSYDPNSPYRGSRLGMPEYYHVYSRHGSFTVHDSRCLVFQNGRLPENTSNSVYELWGVPEYVRLNKALQDAELAFRSAPKLLDRSVQPVYKMKDLSAELATEEGEDRVLRRMEVIDMARGMLNSLVIDADGEDYDFKTFSYSGVTEVVNASCSLLSAISNIPQTILFGQGVGGLSTTDDTSMENYYNFVERIQKRMLKSNLRYLLSVIFQAGLYTGEVQEMPKITVSFNPLWSQSDEEKANAELLQVQIEQARASVAQAYVDMQVIDPSEVRRKLAESETFDVETMLDDYSEEELEENAPQGVPGEMAVPGATTAGMPAEEPASEVPPLEAPPAEADQTAQTAAPEAGGAAGLSIRGKPEEEGAPEEEPQEDGFDDYGSYSEWFWNHLDAPPKDLYAAKKYFEEAREKDGIRKDQGIRSVGVVVVRNGRVLCGTRTGVRGGGLLCGPGGYVEPGEDPEEAAAREMEEEFGIRPLNLTPLIPGPQEEAGAAPMLYLCTEYEGRPHPVDYEIVDPVFVGLDELEEHPDWLFESFRDGVNILLTGLSVDRKKEERDAESQKAGGEDPVQA